MYKYRYEHVSNDIKELHWLKIKKRIIYKIALLAYKSVNGLVPPYLQEMFQYAHHGHLLKLVVPSTNLLAGRRSFSHAGPRIYNTLPCHVTLSNNIHEFKNKLKTHLFPLSDNELCKYWIWLTYNVHWYYIGLSKTQLELLFNVVFSSWDPRYWA